MHTQTPPPPDARGRRGGFRYRLWMNREENGRARPRVLIQREGLDGQWHTFDALYIEQLRDLSRLITDALASLFYETQPEAALRKESRERASTEDRAHGRAPVERRRHSWRRVLRLN